MCLIIFQYLKEYRVFKCVRFISVLKKKNVKKFKYTMKKTVIFCCNLFAQFGVGCMALKKKIKFFGRCGQEEFFEARLAMFARFCPKKCWVSYVCLGFVKFVLLSQVCEFWIVIFGLQDLNTKGSLPVLVFAMFNGFSWVQKSFDLLNYCSQVNMLLIVSLVVL